MTTLQKFQELANIKFVEHNGDIEIGTLQTADGYEIYYIAADLRNLNFENEVYYYQPDFDTIMSAIDENRFNSEHLTVACYDIEDYFDEFYMLDYISDNVDEEEFEDFTEARGVYRTEDA
tara:strand:+ start:93 stop:452 length:360 start_codon:yes stop_codon:yes gene_type:complete